MHYYDKFYGWDRIGVIARLSMWIFVIASGGFGQGYDSSKKVATDSLASEKAILHLEYQGNSYLKSNAFGISAKLSETTEYKALFTKYHGDIILSQSLNSALPMSPFNMIHRLRFTLNFSSDGIHDPNIYVLKVLLDNDFYRSQYITTGIGVGALAYDLRAAPKDDVNNLINIYFILSPRREYPKLRAAVEVLFKPEPDDEEFNPFFSLELSYPIYFKP